MLGGFASAWFAGRLRRATERGAHVSASGRMYAAVGGGVLMGVGAKLARGCTSGQALTGGALLSVGSWIFIATLLCGRLRAWRRSRGGSGDDAA